MLFRAIRVIKNLDKKRKKETVKTVLTSQQYDIKGVDCAIT